MDLHYEESGTGTPIVFLHGNPGSSHGWRNILPHVGGGRLLAPDLIGMGRSAKPDIAYSFADHAGYLDAWFDALGLDDVVLVGHDWGGALAFDHAARHPGRVRGVAFFETILRPMAWDELSPQAAERTRKIRTPGVGEELVLEQNLFVRQAFTGGVRTPVADLEPYLAPFPTPESRRPILAWARQLPIGGEPAELLPRMEAYGEWLKTSDGTPKLLMTFEGSPTLLSGEKLVRWCRENIAALDVVACGEAGHHAQEDRPKEIAAEISAWLDRHGLR
ncbi:haloalkane dehalogenase [Amycolatopsis sp. NPDC005961]|uniref:haloalkane dehalogenase n=1 Tax=Amycolatopsis sp. NPDC005961 TaxID=3156720 RepID=UPI0033C52D9A